MLHYHTPGRFGDKEAQEQAAKVTKTKGGSTPSKPSASKPPTSSMPRALTAHKGTYVALVSNEPPADQKADNKLKGTTVAGHKEVLVDPSNPDKKL
jgi:N-acetylmuramoyl-L-alanine amidase CwlA